MFNRSTLLLIAVLGLASCALPPAPEPIQQVTDFALIERDGSTVTRADLLGSPWVADFIFTRCETFCPLLTERMHKLRQRLPAGVRTVSISVDPEYDRPEVLSAYARDWGISGREWLFLTGDKTAVWTLVRSGFLLPVDDLPQVEESPVLHSNRFALVDSGGALRATYDAFEEGAFEQLLGDLEAVQREERRP